MTRSICLSLSLLAMSTVVGAETTQCTAMTSLPHTITAPGIYCLDRSLSVVGTGITVAASDVTVDLNGHTLDISVAGVVSDGRSNVAVRNGTIRGGEFGVALRGSGSFGNLVERMRVEGSSESGIVVHGRGGVVRNNVVSGVGNAPSGNQSGIYVGPGAGIRVSGNQVTVTVPSAPGEGGPIDPPGGPAERDEDPIPVPAQVHAITAVNAPGAVIERNLVSNTVPAPQELGINATGIVVWQTAEFPAAMRTVVAGNRITNMSTGIYNGTGVALFLGNVVSGATFSPFVGGVMAGSSNVAF